MMEQMALAPPLPPKTRRSPPAPTVLAESAADYRYQHQIRETPSPQSHVVKIRINPSDCERVPGISINVNSDMIQKNNMDAETERNPYFYFANYNCNIISSGQVSPSDTLDSGTCSDLDGTPPPLPKKKNSSISVTVISAQHKRAPSLTSSGADADSDDNESSISYDSLNGAESLAETSTMTIHGSLQSNGVLPQGLLQDIRQRNVKLTEVEIKEKSPLPPEESTYQEPIEEIQENNSVIGGLTYDTDCYYNFHLNENVEEKQEKPDVVDKDETFAGYKDILGDDGASTIRSAKGTVRGVKNRVRAGIATFLQINSNTKSYKEKDAGKVVVYTTTMGILRETYQACMKVKQILRTLLVKYEERDVFMSSEYQAEIRDRMRCDYILVPQVFVDGQHVGDVETIERLNETGELRRILKPYKSLDVFTTCKTCGGYRLLPCPVCNGSKKSVHRNHFTTEFVALKCMNCDEVGLVKCSSC